MAIVLPKFPRRNLSRVGTNDTQPAVMIRLSDVRPFYVPCDVLEFEYSLANIPTVQLNAIEASVVWFTQGKGTEDLGVHFFRRTSGQSLQEIDWTQPQVISVELPQSPLSYSGRLIKVVWCVRVRAYLNDGSEFISEQPFSLGSLSG